MSRQIIDLQQWFATAPGRYLLEWEQRAFDEAVTDLFGYHALQLGLTDIDALRASRISHRWLLSSDPDVLLSPAPPPGLASAKRVALIADSAALPFEANSLDLLLLPHTLDLSSDPHGTLREVERVLVPEGRVIISGLNPASLWGMRQRRSRFFQRLGWGQQFLPEAGDAISYRRMRDWMRLLSFEVEASRFGLYRPAFGNPAWLDRFAWLDRAGDRWWPIFGAVYFVTAVKRVRGMTLLPASWRKRPKAVASAPVPVAGKMRQAGAPLDAPRNKQRARQFMTEER